MKDLSNKSKLLFGIIICITLIAVIVTILYFNNKHSSILFQFSHENYAWTPTSFGYNIYSNGVIKEYDNYNEEKELKSAKITKEELNQLKELANKVEDKYEKDNSGFQMFDAGTTTKQIYSERLSKWIVLSKSGDTMGSNSTEISKEILNLTKQLYDKYLNDEN